MDVMTESELNAATATGQVLVDFWATWCGPCRMMGQAIESELVPSMPALKVVKVNVDEAPELAAKFGITGIPTLLVFKDGQVVNQQIGYAPKASIVSLFS